jgi:protein-tyrosine phosphatase
MDKPVLFLCTGNYYRSRFAEILFNTLAIRHQLSAQATSRGLATELGADNVGPLSDHARQKLRERNITHTSMERYPLQVREEDFQGASLVIALDEQEHRPMMQLRFPAWADRIEYWNVPDLWAASPHEALTAIERKVHALVDQLKAAKP